MKTLLAILLDWWTFARSAASAATFPPLSAAGAADT